MTSQPAPAPNTFNRWMPWILAFYLTAMFLWRALTPAQEYLSKTAVMLEMGIDALMIVGLLGLRTKIPAWLFGIALIAGIGLFAIRFTSDAAWWTGHYSYSLAPR